MKDEAHILVTDHDAGGPRGQRLAAVLFAIALHLMFLTLAINSVTFSWRTPVERHAPLHVSLMDSTTAPDESESGEAAGGDDAHDVSDAQAAAQVMPAKPLTPVQAHGEGQPPLPSAGTAEQAYASLREHAAARAGISPKGRGAAGRAAYGGRTEGLRGRALARNGGSEATENAVRDGLRWLASVQDLAPDGAEDYGRWDADGFMKGYLKQQSGESYWDYKDRCLAEGAAQMATRDLGLTALAALAFTGAGHTRTSAEFGRNVTAAIDYVLRSQDAQGCFLTRNLGSGGDMYDHALSLLLIADYYAFTGSLDCHNPVQAGLDFMLSRQQPSGGWDYKCYAPGEQPPRSDLSITGFCLMAMHATLSAGIDVPEQAFASVKAYVESAAYADGRGIYANAGVGVRRTSAAMTAVNLFCRRLLGERFDADIQQKQISILRQVPPDYGHSASGDDDPYQWYYAAMALIIENGKAWSEFNVNMKRTLVDAQEKTAGPRKGSWPATTYYGRTGGRVYSTAISCLCLEVYYRHLPEFLRAASGDHMHLWDTPPPRGE